MDCSEELLEKLQRRRQALEGGPVCESPAEKKSGASPPRRRVGLPAWAKKAEADGERCAPLLPPTYHTFAAVVQRDARDLHKRLKIVESERDSAIKELATIKDEMVGRSQDIKAENDRLQETVQSLKAALDEARNEVHLHQSAMNSNCELEHVHAQRIGSASSAVSSVLDEIEALSCQLDQEQRKCDELDVRFHGLVVELEKQSQAQGDVEGELRATRSEEASLQERLVACLEEQWTNLPNVTTEVVDESRADDSIKKFPPVSSIYQLDPGSDESPEQPEKAATDAKDDIEFAYDWGLELSRRMPIERALQLAQWSRSPPESDAMPGEQDAAPRVEQQESDEDGALFETHLAVLSEALSTLLREKEKADTTVQKEMPDPFSAPIADLEKALATLTLRYSKPVAELEAALATIAGRHLTGAGALGGEQEPSEAAAPADAPETEPQPSPAPVTDTATPRKEPPPAPPAKPAERLMRRLYMGRLASP